MPAPPSSSQVILITGANKGIGYEAAKLLATQQPTSIVLLGTRSLDNGRKAVLKMKEEHSGIVATVTDAIKGHPNAGHIDNVKPIEIDVTSPASIKQAAEQVKAEYGRLDVLMCNAGVAGSAGETPAQIFQVNINGVHDCIEAFLPLIPATGQIVVVASEVGSWAQHDMPPAIKEQLATPATLTWPTVQQYMADWLKAQKGEAHEYPWPAANRMSTSQYPVSKAFIIAYLRSFAAQHQQPKLVIVCPGYCATDLNRNSGHRPASKGGESVAWPILHPTEAKSGQFYQDGAEHEFDQQCPSWAEDGFQKMMAAHKAQAAGGK